MSARWQSEAVEVRIRKVEGWRRMKVSLGCNDRGVCDLQGRDECRDSDETNFRLSKGGPKAQNVRGERDAWK